MGSSIATEIRGGGIVYTDIRAGILRQTEGIYIQDSIQYLHIQMKILGKMKPEGGVVCHCGNQLPLNTKEEEHSRYIRRYSC